jgi:hypothetical protein
MSNKSYSLSQKLSSFTKKNDELIYYNNEKFKIKIKNQIYNIYFSKMKLRNDILLNKLFDKSLTIQQIKEDENLNEKTTLFLIICNDNKYLYNYSNLILRMQKEQETINDFEKAFFKYLENSKIDDYNDFDLSIIINKYIYNVNIYDKSKIKIYELSSFNDVKQRTNMKKYLNVNNYEKLIENIYNNVYEDIDINISIEKELSFLNDVFSITNKYETNEAYYKLNTFLNLFDIVQ